MGWEGRRANVPRFPTSEVTAQGSGLAQAQSRARRCRAGPGGGLEVTDGRGHLVVTGAGRQSKRSGRVR